MVAYLNRDLNYLYVSPAYAEWYGVRPDQCLTAKMRDIVGEPIMQVVQPFLNEVFAGRAQKFERLASHRMGDRMIRVKYIPVPGPSGAIEGLIILIENITGEPYRNLITQLAESQNYLKLILDSSRHGIWGLNTSGKVTFINQRAVDLLGYDSEIEFLDRSMHDLVHYKFSDGRPHPKLECPMYDSFKNRRTHHVMEDVLWRKDKTCFPVSYYSTPVIVNDECIGSVVTFEDTSVTKNLESNLDAERLKSLRNAKLASLGELSAGIAHEINNPLAIISGTVELLSMVKFEPEKLESKIQAIKRSCERIGRIVKGLQKFSRSGNKAKLQKHGLVKIIQDSLVLIEGKAKKGQTPVSFEGYPEIYIDCDEVEIEQVLINLINNAIDAVASLPAKWVSVSLSEDGPSVVLRIMDSGQGIPESLRERLFEPFFTTKRSGEGTGLGLSITKGILDEHNASITLVFDTPHTCFELRFRKSEAP